MHSIRSKTTKAAAGLLGAALVGAGGAATYAVVADAPAPTTVVRQVTVEGGEPAAAASSLGVGGVYERVRAGVVEIAVPASGAGPFPGAGRQEAVGSGFVYDEQGHVVTNQHVVDGADAARVTFADGEIYDAVVVGVDASTDLAVLKVDAPASVLQPLALADSDAVEVGDGVVAVGSPFGLEGTVTSGIVSALHRQMTAPNGFTINDSIQTDAAVNHGNSGGPLLDLRGEVVGVNAQIMSDSGGNDGVGFAIPSTTVRSIADALIADGAVEHAYLGVGLEQAHGGVAIAEVRSGTPAAAAGLRTGDLVTALDGEAVASAGALQRAIDARQPGDTVTLTLRRGGESRDVDVELGTRPA